MVDRPVEEEVGVRAQPLAAALLPRDRVAPGDPDLQPAGGELIAADATACDKEPGDGRLGCFGVRLKRLRADRVRPVRVAGSLERVGNRLPDAAGIDASLPPLQSPAHAARLDSRFGTYPGIFPTCG